MTFVQVRKTGLGNEIVKVRHIKAEGGLSVKPYWNVRYAGEVYQMWFGTKRAAKAYLAAAQNACGFALRVF